jgi:GNAT superfamily N-acetyltransferase
VRAGADRIEEIGKLYAALHDHHVTIAPEVAGLPPRSQQESWRRRRERYQEWLAPTDAFLLLAQAPEVTIGYALVSPGLGMQSWASGERVGELHDLAVLPDHRGRGVGSRLLHAVRVEVAELWPTHGRNHWRVWFDQTPGALSRSHYVCARACAATAAGPLRGGLHGATRWRELDRGMSA